MVKKRSVKKAIKTKPIESSKKIPTQIQIISILYYIGAAVCIIFGLLMALSAELLSSTLAELELEIILSSTFFVISGIILAGLGVVDLIVGRGLWKLRKWARILAIILSCLGVVYFIFSMVEGIDFVSLIILIINGYIGAYLIFSKEVKKVFK